MKTISTMKNATKISCLDEEMIPQEYSYRKWQMIFYKVVCLGLIFVAMILVIPFTTTNMILEIFEVGILLMFAGFFWNPKPVAEWNELDLTVFRTAFIGILGVVVLGEMALFGANIVTTFLRQLLATPLSSLFVTLSAIYMILGPALVVVIPLYLLLPKILRDLWNQRPSIESFWKEFMYHPMGIIGLVIIGTIVCVAIFAPFIAPYYWKNSPLDPILLENLLQPPSPEHILGTNHRGEDIFSRILYGSQISLIIGFAASIVAVFLGTAIGLLSGYYGGILDVILMRITDVFLCLPTLPLMLIFLMLFGQGLQNVIIVIAILGWTGTARMVRSEALSLRERPLTEAAHALGASDGYILIHHILPNTLPLILANMILGVVTAILSEAGIAFLGFVDIHGQPSWGIILHWAWKNAALLANKWWWFIPPGVLIMLTTLGFVFISHTADKVVNPRLRGRR
jgi:peptide/nickel transport system permease protein